LLQQQSIELKEIHATRVKNERIAYKPHQVDNSNSRAPLQAFEDFLIPHDEIPDVVQSLMALARSEHLELVRGEYKQQDVTLGGFMRYQMFLPVKGDAQAIYHFMNRALRAHQTLALNTIQFKREGIESKEVEAQIHWVLITHLPGELTHKRSVPSFADADYGEDKQ
jgi:hypothetical protein